jgi:hypothetical protein
MACQAVAALVWPQLDIWRSEEKYMNETQVFGHGFGKSPPSKRIP